MPVPTSWATEEQGTTVKQVFQQVELLKRMMSQKVLDLEGESNDGGEGKNAAGFSTAVETGITPDKYVVDEPPGEEPMDNGVLSGVTWTTRRLSNLIKRAQRQLEQEFRAADAVQMDLEVWLKRVDRIDPALMSSDDVTSSDDDEDGDDDF